METNVSMLLEKIKVVAEQTRTATVRVADKTGKPLNQLRFISIREITDGE